MFRSRGPNSKRSAPPLQARGEQGYILLALFTVLMVMGIMSGVAIQHWSIVEKREREQQLIFIQEQYAAAVLAYQQDQGALPPDLEALTKKGQKGQLFLRKKYTDPITRSKDIKDWCLLKVGGAGRVVSSCAAEGGAQAGGNLGLGGGFQPGQETSIPKDKTPNGVAPGGVGIVGVHSKSSDKAFATLKRQEETYDRWYYDIEAYRKEISSRSIPGLDQGKGPGIGNGPGGQNPQNKNPFGNNAGFGNSAPSSGSTRPPQKR